MSDCCDDAQDASDIFLKMAIANSKPVIKIENSGFCLNCLEAVYHGNFCDSFCRDDWAMRNS